MLSKSPGPIIRWTSIAAPITLRLSSSAFAKSGCMFASGFEHKETTETKKYDQVPLTLPHYGFFVAFVSFCSTLLWISENTSPPVRPTLRFFRVLLFLASLVSHFPCCPRVNCWSQRLFHRDGNGCSL